MAAGFLESRVVQVHPTLRCNLACTHCYSRSGPGMRGELATDLLIGRLRRLRREGYEVVSFSGGEPLMYGGFDEVAREAAAMGFRLNMITNGLLLTERRIAGLTALFSLIGVSVDGSPSRHDRVRAADGLFARVATRLSRLREAGMAFGLSHCVTSESIEDLPWLVEYAIEQGAGLVQIHPLTLVGRAADTSRGVALSASDLGRVFLIAELLRIRAEGELALQVDIAALPQLHAYRQQLALLREDAPRSFEDRPLSDFVNPVVLDERGHLSPLAFGMAAAQSITDWPDVDWDEALTRYKADGASALRRLLDQAFDALEVAAPRFVDWYGHVVAWSHASVMDGALAHASAATSSAGR